MKTNQLILAALLTASLALTARAQTPPAQAAAAGFNTAVLNDTFTSSADYSSTQGTATVAGAQWYPYFWAKATKVSIANNVMTVTGGNIATVPTYAVGTGTAQSIKGSFFHGYFEASFKFSPTGTSSTSEGVWPGFWLFGMDAQSTQASSFNCPECDIFEAYPLGGTSFDPVQTLHNWLYPGNNGGDSETASTDSQNDMSSLVGSSESPNPNDGAYHTYGCLWTSTGNGTGKVQFYYDNFVVNHDGVTSFAVGSGSNFPGQEQNAMSVILQGSANQPIMVQYVRVWQAGSGSTGTSPTAQTVASFPSTLSLSTSASPYALPANTDQGLALTYSVVSGPATVSGHTLTLTGSGTAVIKATQAGTATYASYTATETIAVTTVTLGSQTVSSFPSTQNVTLGSGAISLTATTSAGQTITYTVVSGPATISGDTLTVTGSGTIVISASAAGNSSYASYSGTETITVTSGSVLTFTQWESLYFNSNQMSNSSVSGATATPQNDGVPNLLKYVYDINPSQAMSTNDYNAMPMTDVDTTTTAGTTYLTLTYRQYAKVTGVTIQVQISPDLQNWTTVTPSISKQISTDPNTGDPILEDEVNTNGQASEFIRLNVTSP
jgi:hypothetical protein